MSYLSHANFVFLDPGGKRWNWIRLGVLLSLLLLLGLLIIFIQALFVKPELRMPASLRAMKTELRALSNPAARLGDSHKPWMRFSQAPHQRKRIGTLKPNQSRILAALLPAGDARSLLSLSQHASELTHVCMEMLSVTGQPARLTTNLDAEALAAVRASGLQLFPMLTNLAGNHWDTDAVEGLIQADDKTQQTFFDQLIKALQDVGAAGLLIDWQGIDPALSAELVQFLGRMHFKVERGKSRTLAEHPTRG